MYVRHGGRWTAIAIPELLRMVDAATETAEAALVHRDRAAILEGRQVFATAFQPGPHQGKAIVAAHLLRHLMDQIEDRRGADTITVQADPSASQPASDPSAPLPCAGKHPHDLPCDECIGVWEQKRAEKLRAQASVAGDGARSAASDAPASPPATPSAEAR